MLKRYICILLNTILVNSDLYSTEFSSSIEHLSNWKTSCNFVLKQNNPYSYYNVFINSFMFNYLFPPNTKLSEIPGIIKRYLQKQEVYNKRTFNLKSNFITNTNNIENKNTNTAILNSNGNELNSIPLIRNNMKVKYNNKHINKKYYSNKFDDIKCCNRNSYNNNNVFQYYNNNDMLCNFLENQINDLQNTYIPRNKRKFKDKISITQNIQEVTTSSKISGNDILSNDQVFDNNKADINNTNDITFCEETNISRINISKDDKSEQDIILEENVEKSNNIKNKEEDIKCNNESVNITNDEETTEIEENNTIEKTTDTQELKYSDDNSTQEDNNDSNNINNDNNNTITEEHNNTANINTEDNNNVSIEPPKNRNLKKTIGNKSIKAKQLEDKRNRKKNIRKNKKVINKQKDTALQNETIEQNDTNNNINLIHENKQTNEEINKNANKQEDVKINNTIEEINSIIQEDKKLIEDNTNNTINIPEYNKIEYNNKEVEKQPTKAKKKKKNKTRYKFVKEEEIKKNKENEEIIQKNKLEEEKKSKKQEEKYKKQQIREFNNTLLQKIENDIQDFNFYIQKLDCKNDDINSLKTSQLYQSITKYFDKILCNLIDYYDSNLANKSFEQFTDIDKAIISLSKIIIEAQVLNISEYNSNKLNTSLLYIMMDAGIELCKNGKDLIEWIQKNTTSGCKKNIDLKIFVKFIIRGIYNTLDDRITNYQEKIYKKIYNYFEPVISYINKHEEIFTSFKNQRNNNSNVLNNDDRKYLIKEYSKYLLPTFIKLFNNSEEKMQYEKFFLDILMDIKSYKTISDVYMMICNKTTDFMIKCCDSNLFSIIKNIKLDNISDQEINDFYELIKDEQNRKTIDLKIWDFAYKYQMYK